MTSNYQDVTAARRERLSPEAKASLDEVRSYKKQMKAAAKAAKG